MPPARCSELGFLGDAAAARDRPCLLTLPSEAQYCNFCAYSLLGTVMSRIRPYINKTKE
jgi:hypothetical protein